MTRPRRTVRSLFIAVTLAIAAPAHAGMLAVFGDTNMFFDAPFGGASDPGNQQLLLNLLDGGSTVLVSDQTPFDPFDNAEFDGFFNAQAGVSLTRSKAELTASLLAGVDLLWLDTGSAHAPLYSAAERTLISGFLAGGGNVGLIGEALSGTDFLDYNALLADIGSAIRYDSNFRCCFGTQPADTIVPTALTAGVGTFTLGAANPLSGGVLAIRDSGTDVVRFEVFEVGAPGTALLLGAAVLVLVGRRRAR